ncbi:sigma 54-interacting transcriptional regulator [Zoogloea sp.]|uniref:sigma-54-dependent transcriptional regulator n=1 Tax=Zoogloea sp. TaxID=49181 RepID=UPI002615FE83|nr:sigma 54-interacting transcriptional regulator [Zoogloea sp.]
MTMTLPRLLILDDLFGRVVPDGRNADRENLCAHFLWRDVTGDTAASASRQKVLKPIADAVFHRAQFPLESPIGTVVENDLVSAMNMVRSGWHMDAYQAGNATPTLPWSMVLLDLCFYTGEVTEESQKRAPGMPEGRQGDDDPRGYFGLKLLAEISRELPDLPVVILSTKPRGDVSLEFSRQGALGFISRDDPNGADILREMLWQHGLLSDPSGEVVGSSIPVLMALREARRAASHRGSLLIRGERGTGKELLAAYAQRVCTSDRANRPFVTVNSAVLRTELFASELFGIEPRTASGVDGKIGLVEAADGGDLFLDEIADMPPEVQAAILRVLQNKQITRVGARQPRAVDVRFISATNADLENDPRGFRADLLDRLRLGGTLWLPPLRERVTDIPVLVERFVREAEAQRPGTLHREITAEALDRLRTYDWLGNVRELRTCLFDAVNRFPDVEHLVPGHLRLKEGAVSVAAKPPVVESWDALLSVPSIEKESIDLDGWFAVQSALRFDAREVTRWSCRLGELQQAQAWLLARYLLAALEATKRRTPEHPEGVLQIHPAVRLMTGDATLTASRAADVIKRLLGPLEGELWGDLREALGIALRLRPRSPRAAAMRS